MQISYHSTLTKIQKLQNLKKKKKLYQLELLEIGQYGWYFFRYETGGLYVPVCLSVRYKIDSLVIDS